MRMRLPAIAFVAWLLGGSSPTHGQEQSPTEKYAPLVSCPSLSVHEEPPFGPEISITNVTFSGFIQMPISDQEEIAASIKRLRCAHPLDGVVEETLERVRAGWQNHGYVKAEVSGDAKTLTTSATMHTARALCPCRGECPVPAGWDHFQEQQGPFELRKAPR